MRLDQRAQAERRVVSALDAAACGLDRGKGGLRGSGDDEVDGRLEMRRTLAEDLDAVLERVDAARLIELFGGDRARGVEEAAVDPVLDAVQVDGDVGLAVAEEIQRKNRGSCQYSMTLSHKEEVEVSKHLHIVEAALGITTSQRSLTAFETGDRLAVTGSRLLTLVTPSTRSTTARRGTTT